VISDLDHKPASHAVVHYGAARAGKPRSAAMPARVLSTVRTAAATADLLTPLLSDLHTARRGYVQGGCTRVCTNLVIATTWRCALGIPSQVLRCPVCTVQRPRCGASDGCRSDSSWQRLLYASSAAGLQRCRFMTIQRSVLRGPRPGCRELGLARTAQNHRQRSICGARATERV
jgi:hypothetical protein